MNWFYIIISLSLYMHRYTRLFAISPCPCHKTLAWIIVTLEQALARHPLSWSRHPGNRHTVNGWPRVCFVPDVAFHSCTLDVSLLVNVEVCDRDICETLTHILIDVIKPARHVAFDSMDTVLWNIYEIFIGNWPYSKLLKVFYAWFSNDITSAIWYFWYVITI